MKLLFRVQFELPPSSPKEFHDSESFYVVAENMPEAMDKANHYFKSVVVPKAVKELKVLRKKKDFDAEQFQDLEKFVITMIELQNEVVIF